MPTIKGPITFKAGAEPPKALQEVIAKQGINVPFDPQGMDYSNAKLDPWLVMKNDGKQYQMDRAKGKVKQKVGPKEDTKNLVVEAKPEDDII